MAPEQSQRATASTGVGADLIGREIGPYVVARVIGRGGMGIVYLAHDSRLSRDVALKAVLPGAHPDAMLPERLRREARALASLSHPNLATVYGLEEAGGTLFVAMEYIQGETLEDRLARGPMPLPEALKCAEQIAAGLEAAHERGIIHRDLKPANIMFAADGACKVLDFGLARSVSDVAGATPSEGPTLTGAGVFPGTPAYMSPEQARAEPLDVRSDIFSFGAVLYRCLTGQRPFDGETLRGVLGAIQSREPDWTRLPAGTPPGVVAALRRCLAKDLAERARHIGDVRLDLRDARAAREWERPKTASAEQPRRRSRVRRVLPWAVALMAVVLMAFFAVRPSPPARPARRTPAQRFDVEFPGNAVQTDLERVQLALSPDGRMLVVACTTPEGQALWMRSHDDGRWRRIEKTENGHRPVFDAFGEWLAFYRAGRLYQHRPAWGGEPIALAAATNWYGACWESGSLVYAPAWNAPLHQTRPGQQSPTVLTRLDPALKERAHLGPAPVPGGHWVLYNSWTGGEQTDVRAVSVYDRKDHAVLSNASTPRVVRAERGDFLLFERGSTIFAAPFDINKATVKGSETAIADGVMNDGTRFAAYFDVAGDGTLVYVPGSSFAEESRLAYVNADGSSEPFNDDRMSFCEPVFSAAAHKLAVLVKGKVYRCLVYDMQRRTREFLVTGGDTLSLAISGDGRTLACTVNRDDGYGIDLMSLEGGSGGGGGGKQERIVRREAVYPSDLVWTPDSKFIAFSMAPREGVPADIWLVEPREGAKPRALVATAGADTKPVVSPAGGPAAGWVAYQSDVSGRAEVYLVSWPDGKTTRQVSNAGGTQPAWSPDGTRLYFVSAGALMAVAIGEGGVVAGQPAVVYGKPFGQSDPIAREYAIAPDGRPLIVEPSERRPSVSHMRVITNWWSLLP